MTENESTFKAKSAIKSADIDHRKKINFNIGQYNAAVPIGKQQFADNNLVKERAKNIKWRAIEKHGYGRNSSESFFGRAWN